MLSTRTSSSNETRSAKRRSTVRTPIASPPTLMGTAMKAIVWASKVASRARAIQKLGLGADVGNDHGEPVQHDFAQDPFALVISSADDLFRRHSDRHADGQFILQRS